MIFSRNTQLVIPMILLTATALGCSKGPAALTVPPIESEKVADTVFAQYDKNADGMLNQEELSGCPSLQDAMKYNIDKNEDHQLSREELVERLSQWANGRAGVSSFSCRVTKKGKPLAGAQVQLVPEGFLRGVIQPAVAITDRRGRARMAIDPSHLPSDAQYLRVVQQGYYRVEITHPSVEIPASYNAETTLGVEVSFEKGRGSVKFKL